MRCNGQLSLEYLLLLAAVLGIFAVLLPLLNNVYAVNLFALDSLNAKRFTLSLQQAIEEMSFQAEGSVTSIEAQPLSSWLISSKAEKLFVAVQGPDSREKLFTVLFPNKVGFKPVSISSKTSFLLLKRSAEITLEYN